MQVTILVANFQSKIELSPDTSNEEEYSLLNLLYSKLSVQQQNARYSEAYNTLKENGDRVWDGYVRFFNKQNGLFLSGHLSIVQNLLDHYKISYTIKNIAQKPVATAKAIYKLPVKKPIIELREYQRAGVDLVLNGTHRGIFYHATNSGKGHPPNTPILTPTGWVEIKDLKIGSKIIAGDGTESKILGIYNREIQQTYEVIFSDRTSLICDRDHLWKVQSAYKEWDDWKILPTYKLVYLKNRTNKRDVKLSIPNCEPIQFEKKTLPIDPYVLGIILGDGSICNSTPTITNPDKEIWDWVSQIYKISIIKSKKTCPVFSIPNLYLELRQLGISGCHSWNKFIPKDYLFSSIDDRLAILQGLMDCDSDISKRGISVQFSSTSKQLAEDVVFLIRSLGEKAVLCSPKIPHYTYKGEYKTGRDSYRVQITMHNYSPFRLSKKKDRVCKFKKGNRKRIIDIKDAGKQETICISIDHPSGLYIAKDFIVTHNTIMAIAITESLPLKTLFLVDREELLSQALDKFRTYSSREIGVITSSDFEPREITIGMIDTIYSKLKNQYHKEDYLEYLKSVQAVFVDECHLASSPTWRYVLKRLHNAYYKYGLSGTPMVEDPARNIYLIGYIGPIIHTVTNAKLVELGFSATPILSMLEYELTRYPRVMTYADVYREGITDNTRRNIMIADLIKEHKGKSILVIVKQLDHGKNIIALLDKEGYFISGQDTKSDRLLVYNRFSNKQIPVVIASMIYKYGIDIAAIDVIIYAAADKAPVTILQVLGRGLRTRKDKKELIFYDFKDDGHRYLSRHYKLRKKIYEHEGFEVQIIPYKKEVVNECPTDSTVIQDTLC